MGLLEGSKTSELTTEERRTASWGLRQEVLHRKNINLQQIFFLKKNIYIFFHNMSGFSGVFYIEQSISKR